MCSNKGADVFGQFLYADGEECAASAHSQRSQKIRATPVPAAALIGKTE
jgi:hypothetical protein